MLTTLPIVAALLVGRLALEKVFGFNGLIEFSDVGAILTAAALLIGLMMSGVMSDYKESEKLPAEVACSLETIEETLTWAKSSRPHLDIAPLRKILAEVTNDLVDWFLRKRGHAQNFQALEKLNTLVHELDRAGATNPASRLLGELHTLRKLVTRIGVISRTGFLASGYALLDVLVLAVLFLVFLATFKGGKANIAKYVILSFVPLTYIYMVRLIRDLDDPFEYEETGIRHGAAEVELFPLQEYQSRAKARLQETSETTPVV